MKELYNTLSELGFKDDKGVYLPMLSEFVNELDQEEYWMDQDSDRCFSDNVVDYKNFITQPLNKEMFVPCDEEGNVLEEPQEHEYIFGVGEKPRKMIVDPQFETDMKQYQQALERVVFDVSTLDKYGSSLLNIGTIEQAINNGVKLYLRKP